MRTKLLLFILLTSTIIYSCEEESIKKEEKPLIMFDPENMHQVVTPPTVSESKSTPKAENYIITGTWVSVSGCADDLEASPSGKVVVVGCDDKVYHYINNTWVKDQKADNVRNITIDPQGRPWVVTKDRKIYVDLNPSDMNNHWTGISGLAKDIVASTTGDIYCVGQYEKVYKYNFSNNTWTQIPGMFGDRIAANASGVFVSQSITGQLYQLTGGTWVKIPALNNYEKVVDIATEPSYPSRVVAAFDNGKVFVWNHGTKQWIEYIGAKDVALLTVGSNNLPWVRTYNGSIYRFQ